MEDVLVAGCLLLLVGLLMESMNNSSLGPAVIYTGDGGDGSGSPVEPVFTGDEIVSADSMSQPGKLMQFADAIFNFEGGNAGDLNVRNNNPGNLKAAPDQFTGDVTQRDANGFVIFPTMDAGWSALYAQLNKTVSDFPQINLQQFFARYLGQSNFLTPQVTNQGNPFTYAQTVASKLGVSPTDSLSSIFGG